MGLGLSSFGRMLLIDEQKMAGFTSTVLVWEAPANRPDEMLLLATRSGNAVERPRAGEPLVFELRKGVKQNAFPMGITLGRTDNNDVVIDDNSISRFHAYFQKDLKTQLWRLVDAESKNGTWLGPLKLMPSVAEPLHDRARLRFGDIELTYFEPQTFVGYLKGKMDL